MGDEYLRIAQALQTLRTLGEQRQAVLVQLLKEIQALPPHELQLLWSTVQTAAKVQAAVAAAEPTADAPASPLAGAGSANVSAAAV